MFVVDYYILIIVCVTCITYTGLLDVIVVRTLCHCRRTLFFLCLMHSICSNSCSQGYTIF